MSRKKEIEERLAAIATEAETEGADLEALGQEVDELTQERSAIIEKEEKRQSILGRIAEGSAGVTSKIAMPKTDTSAEERAAQDFVKNNKMYMDAPAMRSVLLSAFCMARSNVSSV